MRPADLKFAFLTVCRHGASQAGLSLYEEARRLPDVFSMLYRHPRLPPNQWKDSVRIVVRLRQQQQRMNSRLGALTASHHSASGLAKACLDLFLLVDAVVRLE